LTGVLEEKDRPDRLHAVLYWQAGGEPGKPAVAVSESYVGAADRNKRLGAVLADVMRQGHLVVIRNAEYVELRRAGVVVERRAINKGHRLKVLTVGEDVGAYEARMREMLARVKERKTGASE
jgi:hypothetical protein